MGKAPHRETLDALKWGGQGDRKGTWKKVAEAAGWLSFCWGEGQGQPCTPRCACMGSTYEWKWREGEPCVGGQRKPGKGLGRRQSSVGDSSSGTGAVLMSLEFGGEGMAKTRGRDETEQV